MSRFLIAPTGHSMPLCGGEICVGSDPCVQIPVRADMGLQPRHFAIALLEGRWHLGAYEGAAVWVNGQPVRVTALRDGDRIVAGQLELTYRDEQEAARATAPALPAPDMAPLSPPPLRMGRAGMPADGGAGPPVCQTEEVPTRRGMSLPAHAATRIPAVSDATGWSIGRTFLLGGMMTVLGILLSFGFLFLSVEPLKQGELVTQEARILNATRHQPRKGLHWTELHLDPPMNRIIELPPDLSYSPAWRGGMAKIGFVKKVRDDTHLNEAGKRVPLKVITLEVEGKLCYSLARYNAEEQGYQQLYMLTGPFLLLVGLVVLHTAWQNWKVERGPVRLDPGDAALLAAQALQALARSM